MWVGSPVLAFFRSIDGGLISSMKYLASDSLSMVITGYRTVKVSSDPVPKVYVGNILSFGGVGYQILSLAMR